MLLTRDTWFGCSSGMTLDIEAGLPLRLIAIALARRNLAIFPSLPTCATPGNI
jgi:hypothetical protein